MLHITMQSFVLLERMNSSEQACPVPKDSDLLFPNAVTAQGIVQGFGRRNSPRCRAWPGHMYSMVFSMSQSAIFS